MKGVLTKDTLEIFECPNILAIPPQVNSVFLTFLAASRAIFHPNLFGAYRHVAWQECCDWFSEVWTRAGQPTKREGIGPHTGGIFGIMMPPSKIHYSAPFIRELDIRLRGLSLGPTVVLTLEGPHTAFSTPFIRELDICLKTNISGQIVRTEGRPTKLGEHLTGNMGPHNMQRAI